MHTLCTVFVVVLLIVGAAYSSSVKSSEGDNIDDKFDLEAMNSSADGNDRENVSDEKELYRRYAAGAHGHGYRYVSYKQTLTPNGEKKVRGGNVGCVG